tara:strand:- start:305 stop:448 length:144 start_codon:yes stop_codon:yes gene_type:complete
MLTIGIAAAYQEAIFLFVLMREGMIIEIKKGKKIKKIVFNFMPVDER